MTDLAVHILIFIGVGCVFPLVPLLIGKFVRPRIPTPEKDAVYECGEPTIGSSYIQFDLRFYVVALLFVIFDVEVAFFFPWGVGLRYGHSTGRSGNRHRRNTDGELTDRILDAPAGTTTASTPSSRRKRRARHWR